MRKQRYYLHPGEVVSKSDGQVHFIDDPQLARLYGLDYFECFVIHESNPESHQGIDYRDGDLHFYPKYDGDYSFFPKV